MASPRQNASSRFSWRGFRKQSPPAESPQPLPYIADAFQDYIRNHIPARLLDTSKRKFVGRNEVYDIFLPDIAQITDEDVLRRMLNAGQETHPEAAIYVNPRKVALQETIRDVVRYAIFSHRWTESEPNYQDISPGGGARLDKKRIAKTASPGLVKLLQLCETAHTLGHKLVWSDTCCIDKTNPTELSEAIHAMFKWYANAHVCIVHLAGSSSLADFESEPWFKRGWTLQELLAPRRIKFYDMEWRPFTSLANDKNDSALMSALSNVTGIPRDVVVADNSRGIRGRGVWEIMSWAAPRKTTRVEDAAYSLYGLFDVSLPVTYGEGERAFPRLVEAIAMRRPAWDVFAWAGQASEGHPALPSSPACYPRWDEAMMNGEAGLAAFTLTPHELRLKSVPLIPMSFVSEARTREGSFAVTLRPRPGAAAALGVYGDVTVVCGSGRLQHMHDAVDLHVCVLNYRPGRRSNRGKMQVGKTYVCLLLHMESRGLEGPTWLKFPTDNILQIACEGAPLEMSAEQTLETEEGTFDLLLETTHIRAPRAQTTIRA